MQHPPRSRHHSITNEQIRIIKRLDPHNLMHAMFQITMYLGLRPKEAIGLTWSKVYLSSRYVRISQQLFFIDHSDRYELRPSTKTHRKRTLPLGPDAIQVFLTARIQQEKMKKASCGEWNNPLGLIFTHCDGRPFSEGEAEEELHRLMAGTSDPEIGFYDLRHTASTAAYRETSDISEVQKMMGHTNPNVTRNYYIDHDSRGKRTVAAAMNSYTEGSLSK